MYFSSLVSDGIEQAAEQYNAALVLFFSKNDQQTQASAAESHDYWSTEWALDSEHYMDAPTPFATPPIAVPLCTVVNLKTAEVLHKDGDDWDSIQPPLSSIRAWMQEADQS